MSLPKALPNQNYVHVKPVVAGTLTLPEFAFVSPVDRNAKHSVPSMCFLLEHSSTSSIHSHEDAIDGTNGHTDGVDGNVAPKTRLMFDLGLRASASDYIPEIQAHLSNRAPVTHKPSAPETLERNGVPPESVAAVILSHVHWDHHGDPSRFPNSTFVVGHGAMDVLRNGMPGRGSHSHFDAKLFEDTQVVEFTEPELHVSAMANSTDSAACEAALGCKPGPWSSLGPFDNVSDLFGDGAVYVVPAPGHLPGHINLLCRTGPKRWTYLGGDVFHDIRLLTGEKNISTWEQDGNTYCVHIDKEAAEASIDRIRKLKEICEREGDSLEVIVAHDHGWHAANQHRCM